VTLSICSPLLLSRSGIAGSAYARCHRVKSGRDGLFPILLIGRVSGKD
jgi:hypothetical protein